MKLTRITNIQKSDDYEYFDMNEALLQSAENLTDVYEAINELTEISNTVEIYDLITTTIKTCGGVTKSLESMFGENFSSAASMEAEAEEQKENWLVRFAKWLSSLYNRFWTWLKGLFGIHDKEEEEDDRFIRDLEALPEDAEVEMTVEPEVVMEAAKAVEDASDALEIEAAKEVKLLPAPAPTQVEQQAAAVNQKLTEVASSVSETTKQHLEVMEQKCEALKGRTDNNANVERRQIARKVTKKMAVASAKAAKKARAKRNSALKQIANKTAQKQMVKEIEKAAEEGKITPEIAKVVKEEALYVTKKAVALDKSGKLLKPDSFIRFTAGQGALKDDIKEGAAAAGTVEELRTQVIRGVDQKGRAFLKKNKEIVEEAEKIAQSKGWALYQTDGTPVSKTDDFAKLNNREKYEKLRESLRRYFCKEDLMKAIDFASKFEERH